MSLLSFLRRRRRSLPTAHHVSPVDREIPAAAELLDVVSPRWYRLVDLTELRLEYAAYCVLGQLYDDYHDGVRALERYLIRCGRSRDLDVLRAFNGDASNDLWRAEIRRRRVAADLPVTS